MGSPLDTAAQNAFLDAYYGAGKAAGAPAAFELAIFNADPRFGGTELTGAGGYARVVITNDGTNFPAASSGQKNVAGQTYPTSTGPWSDTGTFWVLFDHADSTTRGAFNPLDDEIVVNEAGVINVVAPRIYWNVDS